MSKVEVLSKGQITIPKEVRDALKIDTKNVVLFELIGNKEVRLIKGIEDSNLLKDKSTLTEKGQVTIPKRIRQDLEIDTGDILIFHWVNEGIYFRKQGELVTCPVCKGKGVFENEQLPCFLCNETALIEKNENGLIFQLFINGQPRKYQVAHTLIQHEIDKNGNFRYMPFPKLSLRSNIYPEDLLMKIQDTLQMMLIEEKAPKSHSDTSKFMIPSDSCLNEILELFVTEEAKQEVKKWFHKTI